MQDLRGDSGTESPEHRLTIHEKSFRRLSETDIAGDSDCGIYPTGKIFTGNSGRPESFRQNGKHSQKQHTKKAQPEKQGDESAVLFSFPLLTGIACFCMPETSPEKNDNKESKSRITVPSPQVFSD